MWRILRSLSDDSLEGRRTRLGLELGLTETVGSVATASVVVVAIEEHFSFVLEERKEPKRKPKRHRALRGAIEESE